MTLKFPLSLALLFVLCTGVRAQNVIVPQTLPITSVDALRFGMTDPVGTARFAATGGSMSAIGVDGSTLHTNPAGIGWNRFTIASVSPGYSLMNLDAQLVNGQNNPTENSSNGTFVIPNLNAIIAGQTRSVNWSTFNYGFSYSRLADFNETIAYEGRSEGGIIDGVVENANDDFIDPFRDALAQRIPGVVQEDENGFFSDFDLESSLGGQISRSGLVERSGAIHEVAVGFGGNYLETIMWGVSIGIPFMNFNEERTYQEIDDRDEITFFTDAAFAEELELSGTGFNLKFGGIYRANDAIRVSAAVHTPTFWSIDETYSTEFTYNYVDGGNALGGTEFSNPSARNFNLSTPWKFLLGGAYIVGTTGFVTLEADYSDFRGSNFGSDDFAQVDEAANTDVDNTLTSSIGVRLGGEVNLRPLQVRAGLSYRQVPIAELRNNEDAQILGLSLGAGYSVGKFFVDVAARAESRNNYFAPYATFQFPGQVVNTDRTRIMGILTVGLRGL